MGLCPKLIPVGIAISMAACALAESVSDRVAPPGESSRELSPFTARGSFRSVLRPVVDVSLSARAAGIVEVIHVPEGSPVTAGQAIMSLDSAEQKAELAQAEASLRGVKADNDRAATEFERIQRLRQDNIYSEKQFQEAKAAAELALSRYEQALAAVDLARVRLANRDIVSPIDGIFLKTNKLVGEAIERYETVARVVDVRSLEMVVFCDARYFSLFHLDQRVDLKVLKSSEDQPLISGIISHVDPVIDPSSGTFRVKVRIEPSAQAVPGFPAILIAPGA